MASCITSQWASTAPQVKLTVTQTASTDTTATLTYTLQYIADYAANTSVNKSYSVTIAGEKVASGTYNIDGKTGTNTICSGTKVITKGTSAKSVAFSTSFAFNLTWSGTYKGTLSASSSISVAAKTSYAVTYNANGGSGAPSAQTKWYGTALTLSSTKPTRTGYVFQGWATSSSGSVAYAAGASYTANAAVTLYAVWKANTYAVKYNANGGTGAPASQTKTYGTTLKLSSTKPTRTNYTFKGWGTSASATTVAYAAGANYTNNAAITLYAVWELAYTKPRITGLTVDRCTSNGTLSDTGTYAKVAFSWASDQAVSSITVQWKSGGTDTWSSQTISASGTSGTVSQVCCNGSLSVDATYTVSVTVTDAAGYTTILNEIGSQFFTIDIKAGGTGAAFGKAAELEGVLDIGFQTRFVGGILHEVLEPETDLNDVRTPATYVGENISNYQYLNCPMDSGTFTLEVVGMGSEGQVKQRLSQCRKVDAKVYERIYYQSSWGDWVCVSDYAGSLLWSGVYYMNGNQSVTFSETIDMQRSGVVLIFSEYSDGEALNQSFACRFVPKYIVEAHSGKAQCFTMCTSNLGYFATKYLYISNTGITGHANNEKTITGACGITATNNRFVLRYVIGV